MIMPPKAERKESPIANFAGSAPPVLFALFAVATGVVLSERIPLPARPFSPGFAAFFAGAFVLFGALRVWGMRSHDRKTRERIEELEAEVEEGQTALSSLKIARENEQSQYREERSGDMQRIQELEKTKLAVLNLLEDIEAEKERTSEARSRLEAIISSMADGVCVIDAQRNVVMCNPAAAVLLELQGKDYVGKPWAPLHAFQDMNAQPLPDDQHPMEVAMTSGKPVKTSIFVARTDGKVPVSVTSAPVETGGRKIGAVAVFRDITTEYQLDRAKSEFVSIASHQLRTPLTAINWYAESIADGDYGNVEGGIKEPVEAIRISSRRMSRLINALLNTSRIETGRLRIAPEPSDVGALVREVLGETSKQSADKGLKIDLDVAKGTPTIVADPSLLKIVVQNMLTNAIKYSRSGGTVTIRLKQEGDALRLAVTDAGIGIPKAAQPHIFEKLYRAENATRNAVDGTGLGLYIAKAIVEQSGGRISFESAEGKGTTFTVTLPMAGVAAREGTHTLISEF